MAHDGKSYRQARAAIAAVRNVPEPRWAYAVRVPPGPTEHTVAVICDGETIRVYVDNVERSDMLVMTAP